MQTLLIVYLYQNRQGYAEVANTGKNISRLPRENLFLTLMPMIS
jgi:hypothetical protein